MADIPSFMKNDVKNFEIFEESRRAAAELSKVDNSIVSELGISLPENLWYFNRLIVDKKLRGRGMSNTLLSRVIEWADQTNATIILDINPYGDLLFDDLKKFYMKFNFRESGNENYHLIYQGENKNGK